MSTTSAATPLTRYGSRLPTSPARPTANTAPAAAAPQPAVPPTATIHAMIVCLPDGLPRDALTDCRLDRLFGVSGSLQPRFWASPAIWPWQRGQLFALGKGRPACCAGGPVRLLDLAGMRHAAAVGAGIRHQLWQRVVHGTRPATPWPIFLARHLADPRRYPYPAAQAAFGNQPRVNAMRMHNAATPGSAHLPVAELEMFQAGPTAYQHYSACTAICGDALLTADGHQLTPDSDALTHRVTYLEHAVRHLDTLTPGQRLLAVAL
jgi:hypothetical protein